MNCEGCLNVCGAKNRNHDLQRPTDQTMHYPYYLNKSQLSSLPVAELLESVENVEGWDCKFDPTIFLVPGFRS